ncbi:MAG: hypothetical protein ACPGTS_00555 [Minisyncoccia bacterium]
MEILTTATIILIGLNIIFWSTKPIIEMDSDVTKFELIYGFFCIISTFTDFIVIGVGIIFLTQKTTSPHSNFLAIIGMALALRLSVLVVKFTYSIKN